MTEKAKKENKSTIIGICIAVVAVIIIIIAAIISANGKQALGDSYFVSDGSKYVLTIESDSDEDESAPVKTHVVYFYSGDEITGAKTYYEFANAETAQAAYDSLKDSVNEINSLSVDGKYVIIVADESEYADITASEVKQQIEFMESLQNLNYEDSGDSTEESDIEIVEVNTEE